MAFLWLINGGDPNHLLTGMILQEPEGASINPALSSEDREVLVEVG